MEVNAKRSRFKLWLGFGLMSTADLVWVVGVYVMAGSMGPIPTIKPGASAEKLAATHAALQALNPMRVITGMLTCNALSGILFVGGMVVTGTGLIDYAVEAGKRSVLPERASVRPTH